MIDVTLRDLVIQDHIYCHQGPFENYSVKQVFDDTHKYGKFHYHMSNFGHQFLMSWDKNMLREEPVYYPEIEYRDYVFAACFSHYWSKALFSDIPEWVYGYRFETPRFQFPMPLDKWEAVAPGEFIFHNYYMEESGVWYI